MAKNCKVARNIIILLHTTCISINNQSQAPYDLKLAQIEMKDSLKNVQMLAGA
jgi:hypothetical protein